MNRIEYEYSRTRRDAPPLGRNGTSEPPIGELFRQMASQAQRLVHLEIQLAKTEISEKIDSNSKNGGLLIGGGFVAYAGFIGIMMALGFLLGTFMPDWLGFLITGVLVALVGIIALQKGLSGLKKTQLSLKKTAESIEEDKEWIRQEASDVKKDPAHLGSHR